MEFQDTLIRWANLCFCQGSALRNFRLHIFMFSSNFPWSVLLSNIEIVPLQSFEHFLTSFLWSIRVQTMEKCCRFVCFFVCFFTITLTVFRVHFRRVFSGNRAQEKEKTYCATMTSFRWSVLWTTLALDQSALEKSLTYCKNIFYSTLPNYLKKKTMNSTVSFFNSCLYCSFLLSIIVSTLLFLSFQNDYYNRPNAPNTIPLRWLAPEGLVIQEDGVLVSKPPSSKGNVWWVVNDKQVPSLSWAQGTRTVAKTFLKKWIHPL